MFNVKKKVLQAIYFFEIKLKRLFYEEILVIGDSHAEVFLSNTFNLTFKKNIFNVISIGGATVSGLDNPNSKTQAMQIFSKYINKTKAETVIVLLGEVDTGFVIWYRAEKYKLQVSEMYDKALRNYKELLINIKNKNKKIICISTPIPTIMDNQEFGDVANLRKEISATQKERTELTLNFNKDIEHYCLDNDIKYISLDKESLDKNGLVKKSLLNDDYRDHHYNRKVYSSMIIEKLKYFI